MSYYLCASIYLLAFKERLKDVPLVVEFRNCYWHDERSLAFLKENHIGYCIVDEPKLKGLMPYNPKATTKLGYFRFHGRNTNWFDASVAERYDYLYTPEELKSFVSGIKQVSSITSKTIVMFNNCHAGKSVKNAIEMLNLSKNILAFL
ncbi:conserved hypothetical protein [Candidatus Brocadia pituitae]|nr:conserved hypothetical protein [Candidatus Brocadia pituitae]